MDSQPGTYALVLELRSATGVEVGRLGWIRFESPFYLYFGSAFGPGGLKARIGHHLRSTHRIHWHIDYLRQAVKIVDVWYTFDEDRLECFWARTALSLRGASPIPRFGSSDCRCPSHLLALSKRPSLSAFRRRSAAARPGCRCIRLA